MTGAEGLRRRYKRAALTGVDGMGCIIGVKTSDSAAANGAQKNKVAQRRVASRWYDGCIMKRVTASENLRLWQVGWAEQKEYEN